ncbi:hypothetical protein F4813DRAFT_380877 [Daldinia decipiens]|uniref:uncharacterized protein n=1 Tax=Daldinia decipiens TaxID=326647 RepID=UPI0020C3EABF|nr:uncharacterized protein F4813DRAFT_380877 [Daldinia decipiens]KAI1657396.1 hypothetical protein F4813DRAFT_380877 [Daldinia decipiens]
MSPSILIHETKQLHNRDEIILSYLPVLVDKPEKHIEFGSDLSTVVDIESDRFSLDGQGGSPGPPLEPSKTPPSLGVRGWFGSAWRKNKAPVLVFAAQFFGSLMNLIARLLEIEEGGMHPMQILFARMSMTVIGASAYIWWKRIPHGVLGHKDIRWLLVLRGFSGFFGIYGMWYSVKYIPLAEATVITFLAPNIAGYLCHIFMHEPFTRVEQLSSLVALAGVVLITRPASLFSDEASLSAASNIAAEAVVNATAEATSYPGGEHISTSAERLKAIGVALLGVLGAAVTFTTLRCIGKRAHPLISVNYFSSWTLIVTTTTLSLAPMLDYGQPDLRLELPHSIRQCALLIAVAACGVIMQILMTAGLAIEKSNRETAMTYTHMLFAAGFDRWVFGNSMGWTSLTGCGLIVSSALWVVLTKKETRKKGDYEDVERGDIAIATSADNENAPMLCEDMDRNAKEEECIMLKRVG